MSWQAHQAAGLCCAATRLVSVNSWASEQCCLGCAPDADCQCSLCRFCYQSAYPCCCAATQAVRWPSCQRCVCCETCLSGRRPASSACALPPLPSATQHWQIWSRTQAGAATSKPTSCQVRRGSLQHSAPDLLKRVLVFVEFAALVAPARGRTWSAAVCILAGSMPDALLHVGWLNLCACVYYVTAEDQVMRLMSFSQRSSTNTSAAPARRSASAPARPFPSSAAASEDAWDGTDASPGPAPTPRSGFSMLGSWRWPSTPASAAAASTSTWVDEGEVSLVS